MSAKRLIMLVASILLVTLWGCGSSMNSSGDVTSDSDGLANAAAVGINNCLTCHNPATTLLQGWMAARHGNHLLAAARLANDALESL